MRSSDWSSAVCSSDLAGTDTPIAVIIGRIDRLDPFPLEREQLHILSGAITLRDRQAFAKGDDLFRPREICRFPKVRPNFHFLFGRPLHAGGTRSSCAHDGNPLTLTIFSCSTAVSARTP